MTMMTEGEGDCLSSGILDQRWTTDTDLLHTHWTAKTASTGRLAGRGGSITFLVICG